MQNEHAPRAAPDLPRDGAEGDLKTYFRALLEQRWLVGAIAALVTLAGVLYAGAVDPVYEANLIVRTAEPGPAAPRNLLGEPGATLDSRKTTAAEIELLRSRVVIAPAVERLRLDVAVTPERPPLVGHWLDSGPARLAFPGYADAGRVALGSFEVPEALLGQPFTLVAEGAGGYRLEGRDGAAWRGSVGLPLLARTARGEIRLLVERIDAAPGARFTLTRHALQSVVAGVQRVLTVAELGKQSGVIELRLRGADPARVRDLLNEIGREYLRQNLDRASIQAERSLALLERQLPDLKSALERAEADYHAFRLRHGTVNLDEEGKIALQQSAAARTRRFEIEQRRNELLTRLGENHPTIAGLNRQLADIDAQVRSSAAPAHTLPLLEQEELRLTRDIKVNTEQYAALSSAAQQLRVLALAKASNVELVDPAVLPDRPVKPNRPLIVFGAAVAGLFLGMVAALLRRALHDGIHSVDRLERSLGERVVLANIPHSEEQQRLSRGSRHGAIPLLATAAPGDPAVEALRGLRAALQFALPRFRNNIVMITGPTAGLGKSFVSANMAAVIAASGRKTLLIDMDLRNGELHRYFGVEQSNGLYEAVLRAPGAERSIRYDVLDNLDFVPTGACTAGTGELLIQRDFDAWLSAVSAHYDLVVVDAPPVLAVADAAIIGARAGAVLLVARAGVTTEHQVGEAVRRLNQAGISPEGILFNDARLARRAPEYQYKIQRTGRLGWHA